MTSSARTRAAAAISLLDAHSTYLSDRNEAELIERAGVTDDVADLALRTCLCGTRIDGFDECSEHLRVVLGRADDIESEGD